MLRRLFKTGNSIVLSLPREMLDGLKLSDGDEVNLVLEEEGRRLVVTKVEKAIPAAGIDPDFSAHLEGFLEEYRSALEDLAR
ncbi:MAG: AbrB/MazE/SpoVT family DNA-binding domain-containing protein [Leptolinea sp.]|nr:AbrB/MazE/SpoVT family DNA-binding domain-containing protein [Leptolinea sp.]